MSGVDALVGQVAAEDKAAARRRAAYDAAFFGFSPSQVLNSDARSETSNVCGNGVLLESQK
eukprot:SAG11_NODE_12869_length_681_cov_6.001718_2_plen_61_part_00